MMGYSQTFRYPYYYNKENLFTCLYVDNIQTTQAIQKVLLLVKVLLNMRVKLRDYDNL